MFDINMCLLRLYFLLGCEGVHCFILLLGMDINEKSVLN